MMETLTPVPHHGSLAFQLGKYHDCNAVLAARLEDFDKKPVSV
jgi:hypothetical protein